MIDLGKRATSDKKSKQRYLKPDKNCNNIL